MGIKGVIFDFNGTLFWDTHLHNQAWDWFLEKYGIHWSDKEKDEKIHGKNNRDIIKSIFPDLTSDKEIYTLSSEKEKFYQNLCLQKEMELAPGATEFLLFLMKNHIPFTIATASEKINVDFYFEQLGLSAFFDRSNVIFNDGTIASKPNPQIFQKAMDKLGLIPSQTLIFEDSAAGIMAAENAGVTKIIIVNSIGDSYFSWSYQKIKSFSEVDETIFYR
jgi:beta-phosphoglucomutase